MHPSIYPSDMKVGRACLGGDEVRWGKEDGVDIKKVQ